MDCSKRRGSITHRLRDKQMSESVSVPFKADRIITHWLRDEEPTGRRVSVDLSKQMALITHGLREEEREWTVQGERD
jgi:hypothetical protein